jgi:putative transposase
MGKIHKALKIRIYPTQKQTEVLNKNLGAARAIFNMMLYERKSVYEQLKDDKRALYEYKYKTEKEYKEEYDWLKEVDSIALQQSRIDLSNAYSNFFKSLSGKRKGKSGFPKFKKKKNGSSYRTVVTNNNIQLNFDISKVKLPKVGWIKFRDERNSINGIIKSATVSRTSTGKYFVSILIEEELELEGIDLDQVSKDKILGLDMSLSNFFVDQNGNSPAYERLYRKYEPKLKKAQRKLSKKKLGSKNWYKALQRVSIIHEKIANKRKDFTHKLSTQIVDDYTIIVVENLNLRVMSQCLNLGKSIMDLGYSQFIHQLKYKTLWNNKFLLEADKWFASSKTCSKCGYIKKDLTLADRFWYCPCCGVEHNRDINAGKNLQNYGLNYIGQELPEFKPMEPCTSGASFCEVVSAGDEVGRCSVFS